MSLRVLITDGDQRAALACVRSLGRRGHACFVLGPEKGSLAGASRYCARSAVAPDPGSDARGFLSRLEASLHEWRPDYLLPITEKSLRVVLPEVSRLPGVRVPFPPPEVFSRVSDKSEVLAAARTVGIDVPEQWLWRNREETLAASVPEECFPLAVKPTLSVPAQGAQRGLVRSVSYLQSPGELSRWLDAAREGDFPALAQVRVFGEGVGVFLLLWEGTLRAVVGHRRVREKPPSGGVSVVRESTVVPDELLDRSLALLGALGWRDGVAMVEYKVDEAASRRWLMEINGRFWGSLQLAIDAGVDFPALLLECAEGHAPERVVVGRPGVRTRWLMGDVDQLLLRLRRSREALDLPDGFPGRFRGVLDFLSDFRPGTRLEVARWSDPRPFFTELRHWFRF